MRTFVLLLLTAPVLAGGPKWSYSDNPKLDDEVKNIYHDIRTVEKGSTRGVKDGSSANAGEIGEYLSSYAVGAAMSNGGWANITSISLTPGDWDVYGMAAVYRSATVTFTGNQIIAISQYSAGTTTDHEAGVNLWYVYAGNTATIANLRYTVASNTTLYLKVYADWSAGTGEYNGRITARRVR